MVRLETLTDAGLLVESAHHDRNVRHRLLAAQVIDPTPRWLPVGPRTAVTR